MSRMTIEISSAIDSEMTELIEHGGMNSSKVDVIRNALALYIYAMKENRNGNNIAVVDKDSRVLKEIVMSY